MTNINPFKIIMKVRTAMPLYGSNMNLCVLISFLFYVAVLSVLSLLVLKPSKATKPTIPSRVNL